MIRNPLENIISDDSKIFETFEDSQKTRSLLHVKYRTSKSFIYRMICFGLETLKSQCCLTDLCAAFLGPVFYSSNEPRIFL